LIPKSEFSTILRKSGENFQSLGAGDLRNSQLSECQKLACLKRRFGAEFASFNECVA